MPLPICHTRGMLAAPIPANESDRLAALRELLILDTPPEQRFDKIVHFAANEFDVPIALVSLIDSGRQWFKARHGLEVCKTGRDISFCGHAIHQAAHFIVEDAAADPRFADNPLVTGEPHIRFYAGAPLQLPNGYTVGTLCLIDRVPRALDHTAQSILATLRDLVIEELVRRGEDAAQ